MALTHLTQPPHTTSTPILSDSLSCLNTINSHNTSLNNPLHTDILHNISNLCSRNIDVTFHWIPSHVGIKGNEVADNEAKTALYRPNIDIDIARTLTDTNKDIDATIMDNWQTAWNISPTGSTYRLIQPIVSKHIKYRNRTRRKEIAITRLRLGHCALNHYLHLKTRHPTGLCDTCHVEETIDHYLLHCTNMTEQTTQIQAECTNSNLPFNTISIFNSPTCTDIIYSHIDVVANRI